MDGTREKVYEQAIRAYLMSRKWKKLGTGVMAVVEDKVELSEEDMRKIDELHEDATAVDDVSGVTLDPREVLKARLEEVAWMRKKRSV